jgi:hypothetical protein
MSVNADIFCIFVHFVVYNTNINTELYGKNMKVTYISQQQIYSDRRNPKTCEDLLEIHEPKDHLHPNYCHWAWLPKPR